MSANTAAAYAPAQTALLLLDYHAPLLERFPDAKKKEILGAAKSLLDAARTSAATIVHCLIDINHEPLPTSKLLDRWNKEFKPTIAGNPEKFNEHPDLKAPLPSTDKEFTSRNIPGCVSALGEPCVIDKNGAVETGSLVEELRRRGIKSLVICGIITRGAVLQTALNAANSGFVATVVRDGCADYEEEVHSAVLDWGMGMTVHVADSVEGSRLLKGGE